MYRALFISFLILVMLFSFSACGPLTQNTVSINSLPDSTYSTATPTPSQNEMTLPRRLQFYRPFYRLRTRRHRVNSKRGASPNLPHAAVRAFGVDVARTRKIIVRALRKLREIPDININVSRLKKQEELIAEKKETKQIETLLITGKSEQVESKKIKDVFFSTRIATVLARANITNIDDLLCINDFNAIFNIRYIGITSILEIIRIMYELGYSEWVQQTLCNTKGDLRDTLINQLAAYKKEISAHCRF